MKKQDKGHDIIYLTFEFYLLIGDKLNTRTLIVVFECLKDRAFHIKFVLFTKVCAAYINYLEIS